jgi:hypothetical protein
MKPRIYLAYKWQDAGHDYELWRCMGNGCKAFGVTPKQAYEQWIKQGGQT